MRRSLALACVASVCGCGGGPTAPTPDFVGNYSFVVEASSVCEMPVERFDWNLVATAAGGGQSGQAASFRLTLPGGDPTLSMILAYVSQSGGRRGGQQQNSQTFTVTLNARDVPFGETLEVTIGGSTRGTASVAGDSRGQILDGAINGTIRLAEVVQPSPPPAPRPTPSPGIRPLADCTAGDHRFMLTPR